MWQHPVRQLTWYTRVPLEDQLLLAAADAIYSSTLSLGKDSFLPREFTVSFRSGGRENYFAEYRYRVETRDFVSNKMRFRS